MKEKIINFKNILRIIISLFVIFSMIRSCAKAYTFDEFLNYCELIKQYSTNTNNKNCANWIINNKTTIQSYLNSISDLNEYTTWYCCYQGSTSAYGGNMYLAMQKKGTAWNWNNAIKSTPTTGWLIRRYGTGTSPTGSWQSVALQNANMSYYGTTTNYIGLIDEEQATTLNINFSGKEWNNFYQQYGTNYLEFDNALENTAYNGNLLTYYYQGDFYSNSQILLGNILPNDSYYFEVRLKESVTGIVKGTSFVSLNTTPINIYNDGAIEINNNYEVYAINRLLKYSTQYQLEIESYYGDGGSNLYEDIDWFIFLPQNAVVENNSIVSLGSGDFTTQDSTNQIIDNQEKNQNWLEETYNNLFILDSGDVTRLIENLQDKAQIGNIGDLSGEKAILETLTGEPGDFVIAWTPTSYMNKVIIPSGEINFSQKVREVPALKTTQDWLRIIMGYSITIVLLSEIFFTILKVLGVSVSIYEQHNEEIERLEEMHTPKVYLTEVATPKGKKKYWTRRTRIQ